MDNGVVARGPGLGGAGNEVTIAGAAGAGGADGAGGAGGGTKMACGSATADPLPYTAGYTPDPLIRAERARARRPA